MIWIKFAAQIGADVVQFYTIEKNIKYKKSNFAQICHRSCGNWTTRSCRCRNQTKQDNGGRHHVREEKILVKRGGRKLWLRVYIASSCGLPQVALYTQPNWSICAVNVTRFHREISFNNSFQGESVQGDNWCF